MLNRDNIGRFSLRLIYFSIPIVAILIAVNVCGDAGGLFSKGELEKELAAYLNDGQNVGNIPNVDERLLQKFLIKDQSDRPDVIVLGSSRSMEIGAQFSTNSIFNHGVSGCSLEDLIAIVQLYRNRGGLPGKILVCVDPWIFNASSGQVRWKRLRAEYNEFFRTRPPVRAEMAESWVLQMISPSYFQDSLKLCPGKLFGRAKMTTFENGKTNRLGMGRFFDGTISYAASFLVDEAEVKRRIKRYTRGDIYSLGGFSDLSGRLIDDWDELIRSVVEAGTIVEFALLPYPAEVYRIMVADVRYAGVGKFEKFLSKYARSNGIRLLGSLDGGKFDLTSQDFYDGMHLRRDSLRKVLGNLNL